MPQQDKEITDILGIPRLTLHSWKTGSSHTKLLYAILKNMSVAELREKKDMAEKVFNLQVINREELYEMLYERKSIQLLMFSCKDLRFITDIDITSKDDMVLLRSCQNKDKSLIAHYILKGSHTRGTAVKFIVNLLRVLSEREEVPEEMIEVHLYGVNLKNKIYILAKPSGSNIKIHDLNEVLSIDKELVMMNPIRTSKQLPSLPQKQAVETI